MEVMCPTQWEEKQSSFLQNETSKTYNICGKSGLQIQMHCLLIPCNYKDALLPFAYRDLSLFVFVWFQGCLNIWKSHGSIQSPKEHSHTLCYSLWSASLLISHLEGEAVKDLSTMPQSRSKQYREPSPDVPGASSMSAFLCELCKD